MEVKHPVSMLQELMAQQHKELPAYEIADLSTKGKPSFHCIVRADNIEGIASASSKQVAKKEAALHALEILGCTSVENKVSLLLNKRQSDINMPVNYNAIGKLNEVTAQKRLAYPTYYEMPVSSSDDFKIQCIVLEHCSEGCGPSKKAAKQLAAHAMLRMLEEKKIIRAGFQSCPLSEVDVTDISDDIILKKFNELSLSNKANVTAIKKCNEQKVQVETNNLLEAKDLNHNKIPTVKQLDEAIQSVNVTYSIDVIHRTPCVLVLKFANKSNTTAIGSGKDYQEAYFNLLQNALKLTKTWDESDSHQ